MDFLPQQVPKNSGGQFFKVEDYFLAHDECYGFKDRLIRAVLKVMCYYPVSLYWEKWIEQPTPEQVAEIVDTMVENQSGDITMVFTGKDTLLQFEWDCLNISFYNPDREMCELFDKIAASEGLFWRKADGNGSGEL